jgi:hypothetical protein
VTIGRRSDAVICARVRRKEGRGRGRVIYADGAVLWLIWLERTSDKRSLSLLLSLCSNQARALCSCSRVVSF